MTNSMHGTIGLRGAWFLSLGLSLVLGVAAAPVARATASYTIVDLGGPGTGAYAISANGVAVGYNLLVLAQPHAVVFGIGGERDLGTLGGDASVARGVNRWGQAAGWARLSDGTRHAFLSQGSGLRDLGTLGGSSSDASAVSDNGTVVGASLLPGDLYEVPFVWTAKTGMQEITLPNVSGRAIGINQHDQVVGYEVMPEGDVHAFARMGDRAFDLGTLGGADSKAYAINDDGLIVGFSLTPGDPPKFHGVAWRNGRIEDLGALHPGGHSVANDVNNSGTIVGFAYTPLDEQVATIFRDGKVIDLNDLVAPGTDWRLNGAFAINDNGIIVGVGTRNLEYRAFELVPTSGLALGTPDPAEVGFAVRVSPSVVRDAGELRMNLPHPARVQLRALDVGGRTVGALDLGARPAGVLSVDLAGLTGGLPRSGVYFVQMTADGALRSSSRFAVVR